MTLRDDLIAARALIDTPEKWCKSPGWKYADGIEVARCAWVAVRKQWGGAGERTDALLRVMPWRWKVTQFFHRDEGDAGPYLVQR